MPSTTQVPLSKAIKDAILETNEIQKDKLQEILDHAEETEFESIPMNNEASSSLVTSTEMYIRTFVGPPQRNDGAIRAFVSLVAIRVVLALKHIDKKPAMLIPGFQVPSEEIPLGLRRSIVNPLAFTIENDGIPICSITLKEGDLRDAKVRALVQNYFVAACAHSAYLPFVVTNYFEWFLYDFQDGRLYCQEISNAENANVVTVASTIHGLLRGFLARKASA